MVKFKIYPAGKNTFVQRMSKKYNTNRTAFIVFLISTAFLIFCLGATVSKYKLFPENVFALASKGYQDFRIKTGTERPWYYKKVKKTLVEGEFSQRGEILDVYPLNFDGPVRIDFDYDKISRIASVNMRTGKSIWQHKMTELFRLLQQCRKALDWQGLPKNTRNVFLMLALQSSMV